jgi:hypothetical protein
MKTPQAIGDINQRTLGTEYYGTSSNYVLLNQLFQYARHTRHSGDVGSLTCGGSSTFAPSRSANGSLSVSTDPLASNHQSTDHAPVWPSVINLLSAEEPLLPSSRLPTPPSAMRQGNHPSNDRNGFSPSDDSTALNGANQAENANASAATLGGDTQSQQALDQASAISGGLSHHPSLPSGSARGFPLRDAERRLESELVRTYLHNLHYLHPMLDGAEFVARCEREVWEPRTRPEKPKFGRHFVALYNIVIAVGALIAGQDTARDFGRELKAIEQDWRDGPSLAEKNGLQLLSKYYFQKARASLGDVFEACSLESAQALLLMASDCPSRCGFTTADSEQSLYCQNSLKPHACYMYCGMAVRTALAIGLPSETLSNSMEGHKAARRTWWCVGLSIHLLPSH